MITSIKPTKQVGFKKKIFGFDIETYDNNKKFLCASITAEDGHVFYTEDKDEFKREMTKKRYWGAFMVATNLSFDFMGVFFGSDEIQAFKPLFRGSDLLYADTYVDTNGNFNANVDRKRRNTRITFIDTFNFARISVEKMGKIIGQPKLDKPDCLGDVPSTPEEWEHMKQYNIQDSKVSMLFMRFLMDAFIELGSSPRKTIASTSMSLFKNKYLTEQYYTHQRDDLIFQFNSYYGGRTEVFKRGLASNLNYYDFNSLYPSVMRDEIYPNPNSLRKTSMGTLEHINSFEGCSEIEIECPSDMDKPILPIRLKSGKVLFPTGLIKGTYTHIEIRYALENGYKLHKIKRTFYFTETCRPFRNYANDLYNLRLEYKEKGSAMEFVVKLLMNSLYGKFGQKFQNVDNWIPKEQFTWDVMIKNPDHEFIGNFVRIKQEEVDPSSFCIPIWASYVTAYGRIKLHKELDDEVIYCDTDSIVTTGTRKQSKKLGELKLEYILHHAIFVRPKFYANVCEEDGVIKSFSKIKGINRRISFDDFLLKLILPITKEDKDYIKFDIVKFTRFKEASRRNMIPNELQNISKTLSLHDEKRVWNKEFNPVILEDSKPLNMKDIIEEVGST